VNTLPFSGGITWSAMSSDGRYQMCTTRYSNHLLSSTDYGSTWSVLDPTINGIPLSSYYVPPGHGSPSQFTQVIMSSDGSTIILSRMLNFAGFISKDYGNTWTQLLVPDPGSNVAVESLGECYTGISDDLKIICGLGNNGNGPFTISFDYGTTFTSYSSDTGPFPYILYNGNGGQPPMLSKNGNLLVHTSGSKIFIQQISRGIYVKDTLTQMGGNSNVFSSTNYSTDVTCLGYNSQVTGNNQLQLGDSYTTVYAYGAVQNRSDNRDKTDVRDTVLGLEFVNKLRPVDFVWDYRENYIANANEILIDKDGNLLKDIVDASGNRIYGPGVVSMNSDGTLLIDADEKATVIVNGTTLLVDKNLVVIKDGSKKRSRHHHGLIAQELKAVLESESLDFGGLQDHKVKGGLDRLTIGYEEFIGPLIKSVQELSNKVHELTQQNATLLQKVEHLENP
jgi:hypothetical protein